MIIVFPMLCSSNVSSNILPGICKVVEKYQIIYNLDSILKMSRAFGVAKSGAIKLTGLKKLKMENNNYVLEAPGNTKTTNNYYMGNKEEKKDTNKKDPGRTNIVLPKTDNSISVEPTWIQVETPLSGLQLLGIKVIPFQVNSDENFVKLILDDKERKKLDLFTTKLSRNAMAAFWRICKGLRKPFIKNRALTGDPKKDLLFASSGHGSKTIALLNQSDFENSNIFGNPKTVQKLHSLRWPSFIIADDVNKMATFCMKEFDGLCSRVAYNFIYASISKDHNAVYNDLEDVRKTASPFFSKRVKNNKVFKESCMSFNNKNYLGESEYITENVSSFIQNMTASKAKSIIDLISSGLEERDLKKLSKVLNVGKNVKIGSIEKICSKSFPGFNDSYILSKKVITNSLNMKDSLIKPVSCIISIFSNFKQDNPQKETRENLKKFVGKMRAIEPLKEGPLLDDIGKTMSENVIVYAAKLIESFSYLIKGKFKGKLTITNAGGIAGGLITIITFLFNTPIVLALVILLIIIIILAILTKDN